MEEYTAIFERGEDGKRTSVPQHTEIDNTTAVKCARG
jgi:hypothetical protein